MLENFLPTKENPFATIDNIKSVVKNSKAEFATTASLSGYATTASVTALETRIAAIETEVTGVAASLASIIGEKA